MKNGQLANARSLTVTNRTRGRKHCALLGKFLEENLENARMRAPPIPTPSSSLTVDDGKLEKYQIEFESWRTVIKSFEFLPPYIFLFPRIGKSIPAYIRIIHPASRLKFCIQSDRFVSYGFQEIKDLRREGKFIRTTKEQNRRCIFFKKSSH